MKRAISLMVLLWSLLSPLQSAPRWVKQLEKNSIIDSVVSVRDTLARDSQVSVYHLYYHQPLSHAAPSGEQFQLRCLLVVRRDVDPTAQPTEVYFTGYDIDRQWRNPVKYLGKKNYCELAQRYHANLVMPEHRYFSGSSPDSCWQRLTPLNAREAAEDFHALLTALKTAFRGKWIITGISKGGITATMQHAFHPEDGDLFVPNCGPFCRTVGDPRLHRYFEHNGWTPALRARLDSLYRARLADTATIRRFAILYRDVHPAASERDCQKAYIVNVLEEGFGLHSYTHREQLDSTLGSWDGLDEDSLARKVMAVFDVPHADNRGATATSMTREQWESYPSIAYVYQACRELGQYSYDFHTLYTRPEEQSLADSLQALFDQSEADYTTFQFPWLKAVPYDDYRLFGWVERQTQQATKPILFLYSEDDPWTGAQMGDPYINGQNVRKYILSRQTHGVSIDQDESEKKREIWDFLDQVMRAH